MNRLLKNLVMISPSCMLLKGWASIFGDGRDLFLCHNVCASSKSSSVPAECLSRR